MTTVSNTASIPRKAVPQTRYRTVEKHKADGATYTPARLAEFVATHMLGVATLPTDRRVRLLDPACGDGALLAALLAVLPTDVCKRVEVVGFNPNE